MTVATLQQLYSTFWQQYTNALPKSVSYDPMNESPFKVTQVHAGEFNVSLRADFNRLKYKSSGHKQDIAVRIEGRKRCRFEIDGESKITQSNMQLSYFRVSSGDGTLTLIESLHYDYETNRESLKNHPIYHCQICNDYIDGAFFGREIQYVTNARSLVHQHIRIPTANMDMISVLLSMAADHCSPSEFQKVLTVYDHDKWHEKLPHIAHQNFSPEGNFSSRSWYIG
jgi:hypothetical protein